MLFHDLTRRVSQYVTENAPAILTGAGMFGTATTAILTGRASFKAAEIIRIEDKKRHVEQDGIGGLGDFEKIKLVAPLYIPPVITGTATLGCIFMAHRISAQQLAAMTALYGLTEGRFADYKDKVAEQFGQAKETKVQDAAAQTAVDASPPRSDEIFVIGSGDVLCLDLYSGRYFKSSVDRIKKAENTLNHSITLYDYADLTSFYLDIGLPKTGYSDNVGWNSANPLDVRYTTAMNADDSQPVIAIDFVSHPRSDFHQTFS